MGDHPRGFTCFICPSPHIVHAPQHTHLTTPGTRAPPPVRTSLREHDEAAGGPASGREWGGGCCWQWWRCGPSCWAPMRGGGRAVLATALVGGGPAWSTGRGRVGSAPAAGPRSLGRGTVALRRATWERPRTGRGARATATRAGRAPSRWVLPLSVSPAGGLGLLAEAPVVCVCVCVCAGNVTCC